MSANINWTSQLSDLAHDYCPDDIYRRRSRFDLSLFGLGPCARREAVIGRTRRCFEHEVITHLNFCRGRLCAVHQFFPTVAQMAIQVQDASAGGAYLEIQGLEFVTSDPRGDLSWYTPLQRGWDSITSGTAAFDFAGLDALRAAARAGVGEEPNSEPWEER